MGRMHETTFEYLKPTDDQGAQMNALRSVYKHMLDELLTIVPDGRYRSLAMTALEESAMWANKGLTRHGDGAPRKD